ncbi:PH domain-containing protein [Microbacterium sp. H1-D42]|uniref:PH domain-containing protein n=1 Tax=Microbacterium sp. H1-D42 TaxID=2925844 RepID=UPI001F5399DF|nr:PH domain-containing protein [Microbacterium sp. H1-D42]UNK70387.1 PH domain-containing protein [Microbacterium sp. H1-D42]
MSIPTSPVPGSPPAPDVLPDGGSSSLADGEWHRMHPLTPLFKGGFVLIIVAGIVISNMRDRIINFFVQRFAPEEAAYTEIPGDPIDWVLANNLILLVLLIVAGVVLLFIAGFWVMWRFHQFRITGSHVEVRKGLLFRSQRRAPLDRVQGVNLTRPFPARLIGLAKVEVVGAGADSNVDLEYLATAKAEAVRTDILRLASGARSARLVAAGGTAPQAAGTRREQLVGSMNAGVSGLIEGVDLSDVAPESVVKIPTGRLVGSQLVSAVLWVLFFGAIYVVTMAAAFYGMTADGEAGTEIVIAMIGISLGMGIPLIIAIVGITWAQIARSLRYSIAPTRDGIRLTFGLLTTTTETLPPGRIFAVSVSQSLLWRPFGWWTVRINRMSGKSATQSQSGSAQQFNIVLPVGKRADVERVLGLIIPDITAEQLAHLWEHGVIGGGADDPFHTVPRRAAWRHPFSWKRHGWTLVPGGLLLRKGWMWRQLAVFPLARLQGLSIAQGPISRAQNVASMQAHTVTGPVSATLSALDRADAQALINEVARAAVDAVTSDHSHRWAEDFGHAPVAPPAVMTAPTPPAVAPAAAPPAPPAAPAPVAPAPPSSHPGQG